MKKNSTQKARRIKRRQDASHKIIHLDASTLDVHLRSEDVTAPNIYRPVVFTMFDPTSRMITGFNIKEEE